MKLVALLVAVACQVVTSEKPDISPECRGLFKHRNPMECCELPSLATPEDFKSCDGAAEEGHGKMGGEEKDGPGAHKMLCDKQNCVMKKLNILKDDNSIDKEAGKALVDKVMTGDALEFGQLIKSECFDKEDPPPPGAPDICPARKLVHCVARQTAMKCPKWKESAECTELKERIGKCAKH